MLTTIAKNTMLNMNVNAPQIPCHPSNHDMEGLVTYHIVKHIKHILNTVKSI